MLLRFFSTARAALLVRTRFLSSARFEWVYDDPEILADILFATANILNIVRTTYVMPAFEYLGPLQITLGRMIGDIGRFAGETAAFIDKELGIYSNIAVIFSQT